ncbi:MAG: ion channel [Cyanophyceae cyanobacterium]
MRKQRPSRPQVKNVGHAQWFQRFLNALRNDPYYWLLVISWRRFLFLISLLYLGVNLLFALAYLLTGSGIANAQPGSFADAFFFSVQTIFTVGYGSMYPQTVVAQFLMMVELMIGVLLGAMATGLMFARFSLPTARVIFSRVAVVCPFDGIPTLMFRTANRRENQILEANVRVNLLRNEVSREGHQLRRFYDLHLLRHQTPAFGFSWLIMHPIVESSPLYGLTAHAFAKTKAEIWITVTGLDETFSQTIHARHAYSARDIFWSMRFVDIFHEAPDGQYVLDLSHFHDIVPLEPDSAS